MRATAILFIYTKVIFNLLMLERKSERIPSAFNRCISFIISSECNETWVAGRGAGLGNIISLQRGFD